MALSAFLGPLLIGLGPGTVFFTTFIAKKSFLVLLSFFSCFIYFIALLLISSIFKGFFSFKYLQWVLFSIPDYRRSDRGVISNRNLVHA
mmetsp:Transcript_648/g.789  ORF Transcript_648/g.789 Transcript_648/m.789 type:complete len:89 (+) Transcript_648:59-325(+)